MSKMSCCPQRADHRQC